MNQKKYNLISGIFFMMIAVLHLLRLVFSWEAVIGGWTVPLWLSVVAFMISGFLAYEGFRLSRKSKFKT